MKNKGKKNHYKKCLKYEMSQRNQEMKFHQKIAFALHALSCFIMQEITCHRMK